MKKATLLLSVLAFVICASFSFGDQPRSAAGSGKTVTLLPQNAIALKKPGSIHVVHPNLFEVFVISAQANPPHGYYIQWTSVDVQGAVKIELMKDPNTVSLAIIPAVPNSFHNFLWKIPPTVQQGNYYIRISSVNNPSVNDLSDLSFKIIP